MEKPDWIKPPSDFTVYRDYATLKQLVRSTATVPVANDANGHLGNTQEALCDRTVASEAIHFDQAIYFAWPLKLEKGHEFSAAASELRESLFVVYRARSLICSCFNGGLCSVTLRLDDETDPHAVLERHDSDGKSHYVEIECDISKRTNDLTLWNVSESSAEGARYPFIGVVQRDRVFTEKRWSFPSVPGASNEEALRGAPPFLFSAKGIVKALFPAIFRPSSEHHVDSAEPVIKNGLIIISGQTGTLKSTILRDLLQEYLRCFNFAAWGKRRYPHVVTLEDPIEKPIVPLDTKKLQEYLDHPGRSGINFTPRQIGNDVRSLGKGLRDALRQTPAAVIVGETRDRDDWIELLKFASTGHLCFTTTHAGSLVETLRTIIEATKSTTPDLRSSLVEKIVAVVHLRTFDLVGASVGGSGEPADLGSFESMLLPAIWRNVNGGANFFVSDGLSAILPRRAEGKDGRAPASCRGRSDFARVLLNFLSPEVIDKVSAQVIRISTRSDLEGV